ncbi:MAG: hypothetical protein Q8P12_02310, partial [bacterium]|nr:hypothetical protein [bacterium]
SDDAWRRHQEQTRQGQYSDQITNAAGLFNIGQGDKARQDQYNAYQDSLRNLAGFGQNPLDPQSVIDSEAYNKSESDRQQRVADTIGTVIKVGGMLINAKTGQPVTSELGPDTVAEEQPGSYRGPRVARR